MRDLRKFILDEGIATARRLATSAAERVSIEAAWAMMALPRNDLVYASSVVSTLPHKGGGQMKEWTRDTAGNGVYTWRAGSFEGRPMGVPFGAKSRMILLHIFNEAIRTKSRTVTSGASMYEWARIVSSRSLGGMTYQMVADHSMRIAAAELCFRAPPGSSRAAIQAPIVERIVMQPREICESKRAINVVDLPVWVMEFPESILLGEEVFEHFRKGAIPVRSSALQQLSNNSAAIDLYIQVAGRLPALHAAELVSWANVAATFGSGYKNTRQLKPAVQDVLQLVLAVYPEAKIEFCSEGLVFHPSSRPIELEEASQAA
jgi:hypothetical protein